MADLEQRLFFAHRAENRLEKFRAEAKQAGQVSSRCTSQYSRLQIYCLQRLIYIQRETEVVGYCLYTLNGLAAWCVPFFSIDE